ncbi:MnmC family methyltransferase [Methanocaldococcus indicus]|uniref:MnmC family methyltransferase n=1 Tax=Methanocaldococcus indicus TaxID=213231 RepID=UPI003C6CD62E
MLPREEAIRIIKKYIPRYNLNNEEDIKKQLLRELIKNNLLIKTDDNTYTLPTYGELMHSKVGALTESIYKFAIPSKIKFKNKPKILDLCSGLTYNAVAALHYNIESRIDLVEICEEVLFLSIFLDIPLKEHEIVKDKIREYFLNKRGIEYTSSYNNITVNVVDAREFIKSKRLEYDVIFHDAFSPKRDPTLYTLNFLNNLYKSMKKNSVLLSYSSSIPFRAGLVESNFYITEEKSIGRKRGITLAYKNYNEGRINLVDERVIALSINSIPYIGNEKEEIIKNREKLKEKLKDKLIKMNKYISTKRIKRGAIPEHILDIQKENLNSTLIIKKIREYYFNESSILNILVEE